MSRERIIKIIPRKDLGPGVCDIDEALIESGERTEKTILGNVPRFVAQRAAFVEMHKNGDAVVIDYSDPDGIGVHSDNPQAKEKTIKILSRHVVKIKRE